MKHNLSLEEFEISEIESIELIGERETIDITVEDTHMFYANGIYTHNSGMDTDKVGLSSIGESLGNARAADIVISVGRDPDELQENPNAAKIGILKNRNGAAGLYLDAIFEASKIFIDVKPLDPTSMGYKKPKQTNKKIEKSGGSVDDIENSLENINLG